MSKFKTALKKYYWPVSAILFCPCHLPLTMAAFASLTAGTALGAWVSSYYSSIETVLAVSFSFYFVLAFMIWVVRGPQQAEGAACAINEKGEPQLNGLTTRQIITWGIIGMFSMPALIAISVFSKENFVDETLSKILTVNPDLAVNSGFIWLISLATVVMIPVMVIWLVWMWLAWVKTDPSRVDTETWQYEYE
ncbi:MAG: hypothetical protein D6784_07770 [Chloroflexi bacterium]|nr:MAG: hypothetical protein D6784_07770 [Chloroflexota bacterium]